MDEVIPQPSLDIVLQKYKEAIETRKIIHWEEVSEYPTGELTGEVSIAPVFDDDGHCTHLVGAVHDITDRKRAEEALAASEAELRALFAAMNDVVLVIDRKGVYRKIAPTNPNLLYKPPEELLAVDPGDIPDRRRRMWRNSGRRPGSSP